MLKTHDTILRIIGWIKPTTGKRKTYIFVLLSLVAIGAFAFRFYSRYVDISTPLPRVVRDSKLEKPRIFFGVISRYPPMEILRGYQPFMDYLTENTPFRFELRMSRTYDETIRQLIQGETDFASIGKYVYIRAKENHDITCIARPYYANGDPYFYYLIIVPEDSQIQTIKDLKGKRFAFPSRMSFTSWKTEYVLNQHDIFLDDLGSYQNLKYHTSVVEKVMKGEFDAGTVKDLVARRHIGKGIRVIHKIQAAGVPIVAAPHVDPDTIRVVREVLLAMKSEIDGHRLQTAGWDEEVAYGFAPAVDGDYDVSRQVLLHLQETRK